MKKWFFILGIILHLIANEANAQNCSDGIVACGTTDDGFTWSVSNIVDKNGNTTQELRIEGVGDMQDYERDGDNMSPWKKNGGDISITKIIVGDGITSIGARAFEDMIYVNDLQLPESIKKIGKEACNWCASLADIKLPSGLIKLGGYAFYATKFSNLSLPESLTQIDYRSLYIRSPIDIVIPENTEISSLAFLSESGTTDVQKIYCASTNTSCLALKNIDEFASKIQLYEKYGDTYYIDGKFYKKLNDIAFKNNIKKRIYTIDEANLVAKPSGNTVRIKYR